MRVTRAQRVLLVAIIVTFVAFLDGAVINVALPAMREDLGGGLALQQWVVDGYLITLGAFILIAGSLSDSFGRMRIMRIGLYGFGATSLLCAVAPTALVLVIARILQGAAGALLVPSSLALIISTFAPSEQGKAIGKWTAWTTAAFVVGPLVGGMLVDAASWRLIFAINVLPIAVALWLLAGLGTDAPNPARPRVDVVGAILGVLGLGGPVFALIEQGRLGWSSPAIYLPFVLGIACFAAFLWWENRCDDPMMPLEMFTVRNFGMGNIATVFIYAAFTFGPFVLTVFLQEVGGYTALAAGVATLPAVVLLILLASWFGARADRIGPRLFMTVGPLVCAVGFLLTLTMTSEAAYWTQVLPGISVFGLGMAITVAPLTTAILGAVDPARAGIGSAINNAVARVAGLIAVACTGIIVGSALDLNGYLRAAMVTSALLVVGGLVSLAGIRNPTLTGAGSAVSAEPTP
ncbi:drug resistance transporter, EmrB/QacA subfamily [Cryobacterium psychrotolerans]|uniref:Drug resistance transporter, EmrB/QacA subfamily n=1 Tax=Cryobacterium psychrotolerans TaxID=386301 RepID=A0A1G9G1C9_9MICO|nr:drug resistance transporter, EmrB/QacA subfamily [Cryobacterium psychrotolerans]